MVPPHSYASPVPVADFTATTLNQNNTIPVFQAIYTAKKIPATPIIVKKPVSAVKVEQVKAPVAVPARVVLTAKAPQPRPSTTRAASPNRATSSAKNEDLITPVLIKAPIVAVNPMVTKVLGDGKEKKARKKRIKKKKKKGNVDPLNPQVHDVFAKMYPYPPESDRFHRQALRCSCVYLGVEFSRYFQRRRKKRAKVIRVATPLPVK